MKNIFLLCTTIFFLVSCNGVKKEKSKSDLSFYKLKGKVKYMSEYDYDAKDSSGHTIKGVLRFTRYLKFDEKGDITEKRSKRQDDSVGAFNIYKYDSGGHLIEDSGNAFMSPDWDIYLYNKQGNRIERDQYYADKNGNAKRGITEVYKVDENGNRVEEDCYWGNKDSLNYIAYIKNNSQGKELENAKFDRNGKHLIKEVNIYDNNGNRIEYQFYNHDTLKNRYTNSYDDKGKEIESCNYNKDGKLDHKETTNYDDKGNMTESESVTSIDTTAFRFTNHYENFDKEGNWLQSVFMENRKPTRIIERIIEYYQ